MQMKPISMTRIISFALLVFYTGSVYAVVGDASTKIVSPSVSDNNAELIFPAFDTSKVIKLFLKAVDKGQLQVFGLTVTKEQVNPKRVEFVYETGAFNPVIKVYSELYEPIPIPKVEQMCIQGITAVLNVDGDIIDNVAHCGQ